MLAVTDHLRNLEFRIVTEQSDVFSIVEDWRQLLAESAHPETMLEPSWLLGWWRQYGAGVELAVGQLFDGDRFVGFAPLCIRRYSYCPGLSFRRLQFMGVDADDKDGICSMYMGFVAAKGYEHRVEEAFIDHIVAGDFGHAHEIMLGPMQTALPEAARMKKLFRDRGLRCEEKRPTTNYFAALPETWDEYLRTLPSSRRSYINNMIANFESWASERGGWTLDHAATAAGVEAASATLISLQHERLSPRFLAFQREYLASQAPSDQIELATLRVGETAVACIYTIRNGRSVLAYHYGWTAVPGLDIGVAISALMIMRAIARGDTAFDFLSGGFGFEAEFATAERPVCSLRAVRPSWREAIRLSLIDARDAARAAVKTGRSLARKSPFGSIWHPVQR